MLRNISHKCHSLNCLVKQKWPYLVFPGELFVAAAAGELLEAVVDPEMLLKAALRREAVAASLKLNACSFN